LPVFSQSRARKSHRAYSGVSQAQSTKQERAAMLSRSRRANGNQADEFGLRRRSLSSTSTPPLLLCPLTIKNTGRARHVPTGILPLRRRTGRRSGRSSSVCRRRRAPAPEQRLGLRRRRGPAAAWRRRHPPARHRRVDAGVLAGADDRGAGRGDQHGGLQEPPAAAGEDQKGSKVLFVCSSLSLLSLSFFLFPHSPLSRALFSSLFSLPVRKPLFRS